MKFRALLHKGYSAFQLAGVMDVAYNNIKVLEAHELFSAIIKSTKYECTFEFGYKIDSPWVDVK